MNPGFYIHVPFCLRKCPYCDFYSESKLTRKGAYLDALVQEMDLVSNHLPDSGTFDTLYFGGGTPSLLAPDEVAMLLGAARERFSFSDDVEVTLEVNPGTVTETTLAGFRRAGVNRLNIGVQSLDDGTLAFLGRLHDARQARNVLDAARACGFDHLGADLMYGVPGQGRDAVLADVESLLAYAPEHLSCYMLTLEEGTPLYQGHRDNRFSMPDDALQGDLFALVSDTLTREGYQHYEVSNFAKHSGLASRHNTKYWETVTTVGLGPSAHGFHRGSLTRWWNVADLESYIGALGEGRRPIEGEETLGLEALMTETLYLGLRRMEGIDVVSFRNQFSVDLPRVLGPLLEELVEGGLMVVDSDVIRLTRKGFAVADGIVVRLLQQL